MASFAFKAGEDFELKLSKLAGRSDEVAKRAIAAAAKLTADEIRKGLSALPKDTRTDHHRDYHYLQEGEKFDGVPVAQLEDLEDSLGITPISTDRNGNLNAKVGFDGYGRQKTHKYKMGIPNQLVARAVESGSSIREKHPFVRPAVRRVKKAAVAAMQQIIEEEYQKTLK